MGPVEGRRDTQHFGKLLLDPDRFIAGQLLEGRGCRSLPAQHRRQRILAAGGRLALDASDQGGPFIRPQTPPE